VLAFLNGILTPAGKISCQVVTHGGLEMLAWKLQNKEDKLPISEEE